MFKDSGKNSSMKAKKIVDIDFNNLTIEDAPIQPNKH